jgi:hypothetical protein
MKTKKIVFQILTTFLVALFTAIVVTLFWNLIIENKGAVIDWKTSFLLAIIFGITLPIVKAKK